MTTPRLAAILAADVVGFTAMMEKDEEGTLKCSRMTALRLIKRQDAQPCPPLANAAGPAWRLVKRIASGGSAPGANER